MLEQDIYGKDVTDKMNVFPCFIMHYQVSEISEIYFVR